MNLSTSVHRKPKSECATCRTWSWCTEQARTPVNRYLADPQRHEAIACGIRTTHTKHQSAKNMESKIGSLMKSL
ncbi:hypothetical protein PVAG01_00854 [Phlyctema vagabunda]|uniref:Uncharacterized protein n=1 Tax=Phlyctema vagabunda TaxID=108571 RepID=A0ABR4PVF7_9HELO